MWVCVCVCVGGLVFQPTTLSAPYWAATITSMGSKQHDFKAVPEGILADDVST